jgi:ankyrin repeat protein
MLAVSSGRLDIVKQLLESGVPAVKASIPTRNARGLNAVHLAVQQGYADILKELLKHCDEELLCVENTVGESPVETAELQFMLEATRPEKFGWRPSINTLAYREYDRATVFTKPESALKTLETQLAEYVGVKAKLLTLDKFINNTHLRKAFDDFEAFLRTKVDTLRAFAAANPPPAQETQQAPQQAAVTTQIALPYGLFSTNSAYAVDSSNRRKTLEAVLAAAKSTQKRSLVHILDVQQSVMNSLEKAAAPRDDYSHPYNDRRQWRKFNKAEELPKELAKEKEDSRDQWKGVMSWASLQTHLG